MKLLKVFWAVFCGVLFLGCFTSLMGSFRVYQETGSMVVLSGGFLMVALLFVIVGMAIVPFRSKS